MEKKKTKDTSGFVEIRLYAGQMYAKVLKSGNTLEQAFTDVSSRFSPSDVDWLRDLLSGAIRSKTRLELAIDAYATHKKPTGKMRDLLVLASYQLIECPQIPAAAVVNEWVETVKKALGDRPAQFANAVLRKVSRQAQAWRQMPVRDAASASLPQWMWEKLIADWGEETARKIATAQLARPDFYLYGSTEILAVWEKREWVSHLEKWGASPKLATAKIERMAEVLSSSELRAGDVWVQDLTAQHLVAEVALLIKNKIHQFEKFSILDLCAAPGGKTLALYKRLKFLLTESEWSKLSWVASDIHSSRLKNMAADFTRVGVNIQVMPLAGLPKSTFQLVWIDAPCSGSGVLKKHPESKWIRNEKDFLKVLTIQNECLASARDFFSEKGILVYTVCSVFKAESFRFSDGLFDEASSWSEFELERRWTFLPDSDEKRDHGDGFLGFVATLNCEK